MNDGLNFVCRYCQRNNDNVPDVTCPGCGAPINRHVPAIDCPLPLDHRGMPLLPPPPPAVSYVYS